MKFAIYFLLAVYTELFLESVSGGILMVNRGADDGTTEKEAVKEVSIVPIAKDSVEVLPSFWERLFSGKHENQRAKLVFRY